MKIEDMRPGVESFARSCVFTAFKLLSERVRDNEFDIAVPDAPEDSTDPEERDGLLCDSAYAAVADALLDGSRTTSIIKEAVRLTIADCGDAAFVAAMKNTVLYVGARFAAEFAKAKLECEAKGDEAGVAACERAIGFAGAVAGRMQA